jgi:hypothetical protein
VHSPAPLDPTAARAEFRRAHSQTGLAVRYSGADSERTRAARRRMHVAAVVVRLVVVLDEDPAITAADLAPLRDVLDAAGAR